MDREDTLIILGKSPILDDEEVQSKAKSVHLHYHTVGINCASYLYNTEYLAFVDNASIVYYTMIHPTTKILTIPNYITDKFECEYYDLFIPKEGEEPVKDNKLAYCGFTHDLCLSWAYMKGFKNVILMGVADFTNNGSYTKACDTLPYTKGNVKFNPSDKMKRDSINYISNTLTKFINVYTVNSDSSLNVPRIKISEF